MEQIEKDYQMFFDGKISAAMLTEMHPVFKKREDVDVNRYAVLVGRYWSHFQRFLSGYDQTCTGSEFIAMSGHYLHAKSHYGERGQ